MRLLVEIEKAKIEMWESTVEQGVLTQLVKGPPGPDDEVICVE